MVRRADATVLAAMLLQGGQANVMQSNQVTTRYREDPDQFFQPWSVTNSSSKSMDAVLYSIGDGESTWADYLYPFQWEKDFEGPVACAETRKVWWFSYVASSLYLIFLWVGTAVMKDRKPFDLKTILSAWNLFLAVFSFIGTVRTVPHLFMMLGTQNFQYTLCREAVKGYGSGASGLWVALFVYSKYFELIDTVFLVVRKKKIGFLHWYHHCSVLLYCWHAYVWEMPTGIYFVSMNYAIHSIMYFYYFLAAVCTKPPKWALAVTILQLTQMAVGIVVTLSHIYILIHKSVPNCDGHIPNLTAALGMYASYFILFAQFLFGRYCTGRKEPSKASKKLQ